jgi:quinoprotein glucose dehydrogenase
MPRLVAAFLAVILAASACRNAPPAALPPQPDGTVRALKAMAGLSAPPGLKIDLFAADPMLASPVAFSIDERGRVFVAEEYRFNQGAEENRSRPFLLDDDLQLRTVDDRLRMYNKWAHKFDGGMAWFGRHADQVRLLEDTNGGGRANRSTVFAGGFNDPLDGLAAGVLARDGKVYLTCIPHLWLLQDTQGTGTADVRVPLHRGFGVNCAYLGHDLHGLVFGPDGKLYFSVGDRGFHVTTKEGAVLDGPRTGAVFRCNPDGTELEVVARGLRNPQELAFDQFGNLFAADNNCDKGDHSRLVYVCEGGDSGWNMSFQTIPEPYLTGPWHAERMWHLPHKGQPAWIVPPVGKLGAGPAGFTFTSGLSLPERYRDRFFMCNYTGRGGVESFGVVPKGAGFEIVDYHDFLKPINATDVEVGYDGKVYVSDFVDLLWGGGSAGGRIYTVTDPNHVNDPAAQEVKRLVREGFQQRPADELARLLGHPDSRVRQRAQFALAERGPASVAVFEKVAADPKSQLARLHAVWGLGQLGRKNPDALRPLVALLDDVDAEVRAQAARVIGDDRWPGAEPQLTAKLRDTATRVRFFAALALGKTRAKAAVGPLFEMLRENADQDPFLRHAGVTALVEIGDREAVQARAKDPAAAVRLTVLLCQRRWQDPRVVQFLDDPEPELVAEAARAVHDVPVGDLSAVGNLLDRFAAAPPPDSDPVLRRAISAHYRAGGLDDARAIARAVANPNFSPTVRAEALAALRDWTEPPPRDRVTGFWRPLPKRDPAIVRQAVEEAVGPLLGRTSGKLQADAVTLIARLDVKTDDSTFAGWVADPKRDRATRTAALRLLAQRKSPHLEKALSAALDDSDARLRAEGRDVLAGVDAGRALAALRRALDEPSAAAVEKQAALATVARLKADGAAAVLDAWAEKLARGEVAPELQLDVIEALQAAPTEKRKQALQRFEVRPTNGDPLAKFRVSLSGGDAERGRELFVGHSAAQCIRCHTVNGAGGTAGPDLAKVAARNPEQTREYLLESMVFPNAKIAPGYGSVSLVLNSGKTLAGTLQSEDARGLVLLTPTGERVTVAKSDIDERSATTSSMPSVEKTLTPRELRDLVEYLLGMR